MCLPAPETSRLAGRLDLGLLDVDDGPFEVVKVLGAYGDQSWRRRGCRGAQEAEAVAVLSEWRANRTSADRHERETTRHPLTSLQAPRCVRTGHRHRSAGRPTPYFDESPPERPDLQTTERRSPQNEARLDIGTVYHESQLLLINGPGSGASRLVSILGPRNRTPAVASEGPQQDRHYRASPSRD